MSGQSLTVDFAGEVHALGPNDTLDFGRVAALSIDSNPFLHRRLGRFKYRSGLWFLSNIGRSIHLVVFDSASLSQATIAPGRELALTILPATVRFRAGRSTYELFVEGDGESVDAQIQPSGPFDTLTGSIVPLTPSQRLLIIALAEPTLRQSTAGVQIPANKAVAARLGWSVTKYNRKLDNVCAKLTRAGVAGLHGTPGNLAANRRRALVEFALQSGLVTGDDLALIDEVADP